MDVEQIGRLSARRIIHDVVVSLGERRATPGPEVPPVKTEPAPASLPAISLTSVQESTGQHKQALRLALDAHRRQPSNSGKVTVLRSAVESARAYTNSVVAWADKHELNRDVPEMCKALNSLASLCNSADNEVAIATA